MGDVNSIPEDLSKEMDAILNPEPEKVEDSTDTTAEAKTDVSETEDVISKETGSETEKTSSESEDKTEEEGTTVADRLVQAGRRHGIADERIEWLAENNPELLEDMAKSSDAESAKYAEMGRIQTQQAIQQQGKPTQEVANVPPQGLQPVSFDQQTLEQLKEDYGETIVDKVILPMQQTINTLIQANQSIQGKAVAQEHQQLVQYLDTYFDNLKDEIPDLGLSKDEKFLDNKTATSLRENVYQNALCLMQGWNSQWPSKPMQMTEALERATNMYRGQMGEKNAQQRLVTKLNKAKTKFTARPTHRHSKQAKQYISRDEEAAGIMDEVLEETGIKLGG